MKSFSSIAICVWLLASVTALAEPDPRPLQMRLSGAVIAIKAVSLEENCNRDSFVASSHNREAKSHGVKLIDTQTDKLIWQLDTMAFTVCADITAIDANQDGFIDRLYFANTGGELWRVDLWGQDSAEWQAQLLLQLEGRQQFFTAPDVVSSQDGTYYALLIGSGDQRPAPEPSRQNYLIFYRDYCLHNQMPACQTRTKTLADLQQLDHPNRAKSPFNKDSYNNGWYLPLAPGEAAVTRVVTNQYNSLVATYKVCGEPSCATPGESRIYDFNAFYLSADTKLEHSAYYRRVQSAEPLPEPKPFIQLPDNPACQGRGCGANGAGDDIVVGFDFGEIRQPMALPQLAVVRKTWWHNHRED